VNASSALPPEQFAREWNRFLVRVQNCFSTTGAAYPADTGVRLPSDFQLAPTRADVTNV
jgi:hypothetical protein